MKRRAVIYSPEARLDLAAIYIDVADASSEEVAIGYLARIRTYLDGFDLGSERGSGHPDLRPGLRTVGYRRRLTIAFEVQEDAVQILRIFRAGQDWSAEL